MQEAQGQYSAVGHSASAVKASDTFRDPIHFGCYNECQHLIQPNRKRINILFSFIRINIQCHTDTQHKNQGTWLTSLSINQKHLSL